jgi:hypothetical protein
VDESPKPGSSGVLDELQRVLDGAGQCIELAKQEAARAEASLRTQSAGRARAFEQALLDNARRRREQLRSLDLRLELPPNPPPQEPPPAERSVVMSLRSSEEASGLEAGIPAEALLVE